MSIFATMFTSEYVIPQAYLLDLIPPTFNPIKSMIHATTLAYMPMFFRIFVQKGGTSSRYDNLKPRAQIAALLSQSPNSTFARLHNTHLNALESLPIFLAAMMAGLHAKIEDTRLSKYGTLYIALRVLFSFAYFFQTKSTAAIRSIFFLWSTATAINLVRESSRKLYDDHQS